MRDVVSYWFMFFLLVGLILTFTATVLIRDSKIADMKSAAIEHGCAAYDSKTGEWEWLEK